MNHAGIQKVLSEGVNFDTVFFLVDKGMEDKKTHCKLAIISTPTKRHHRHDPRMRIPTVSDYRSIKETKSATMNIFRFFIFF